MSRACAWLVVAACAGAGCHSGERELVEPSQPPAEVVAPDSERRLPTIPDDDDAKGEPEDVVVVPLGDWGVEITMPREPASRAGASPDWYGVELSWKRHLGVKRVHTPMHATIDAHVGESSIVARGVSESGIPWLVYTFEAYEGFSTAGGNVHHVIRVSRFVAMLEIDATTHVECTGYLEYDIENVDGADDFAKICLSMRKTS